jgi:hypothetical protein
MATTLPSDEVAEDYKASLEDLAMNSRYEISNLTVIAKENTEHAHAISRVLENHIRNVGTKSRSLLFRLLYFSCRRVSRRCTFVVQFFFLVIIVAAGSNSSFL